ncbi:MAG: hypothetical protein NZ889_01605 [Candidatus Pacearchaeota archaeon]|nr:hypothetical protein [Candidatus Pacearchaeota archaeon]
MHPILKILIGIILIIVPLFVVLTFSSWARAVIELLKGGIIVLVILAGIIFIILGVIDLSTK